MSDRVNVPFKVNMPESLRTRLGGAAAQSGRSVTAEIIARLEASFIKDEEIDHALEVIEDLVGRVETLERIVKKHDKELYPTEYFHEDG